MSKERFGRLKDIFYLALGRPPEEREAFVREAAGEDEVLLHEALDLLATYREDDTFLSSDFLRAEVPLRQGEWVGSYRVSEEIGRGGMGVVYLARDTRLDREVAVKAMSPRLLKDPKQQERFRREAVRAASLSHAAIATIYALEEVEGRFYIVSEYIPGRSLRDEMQPGIPADMDFVIRIGVQVAEGLAAAHEKGIVHRDLKPENIRVRDDQAKIIDFGLAIDSGPEPDPRLTDPEGGVGTPAYMSPEQVDGKEIDRRSDIFAFGILLYELALGAHPFKSDTIHGTMARIVGSPPPGLDRLRARSPGLAKIVGRCLEKSPQDRFDSTREIARELQALGETDGFAERHEPPLQSHWWDFHQIAVLALYTTMIVLLFVANPDRQSAVVLACAFVALACGVGNGAARAHLLFTSRFNRRAIRTEVRRISLILRGVDLLFSLCLLIAALAKLPESQPWAAVFASAGVSYAVVTLIVEPVTVRSVFIESRDHPTHPTHPSHPTR